MTLRSLANQWVCDYGASVVAWKPLVALAIVVAGAVGGFAVYTFGWRESGGHPQSRSTFVTTETGRHRLYTIREGDVIRVPGAATQCEASGEAGIPNLFCTHTGSASRYEVVFWKDRVDVYDLARHGAPMVPTFFVPAEQLGLRISDLAGRVKAEVTNAGVVRSSVRAVRQAGGAAAVVGVFTKDGASKFCSLTRGLARRGARVHRPQHFAIAVGGRVYARPWVDYRAFPNGLCGSPGFEWGGMQLPVARRLARLIRGG